MDWKQLPFLEQLPLAHVIEQPSLVVSPETPISAVIAQMHPTVQDYALVMQSDQVLGVFTTDDGIRLIAQPQTFDPRSDQISDLTPVPLKPSLGQTPVGTVIVQPVVTLLASQVSLWSLLSTFQTYQIRQIPILDAQQQLLGVATWQTTLSFVMAQIPVDPSHGPRLETLLNEQQRWELDNIFGITPCMLCIAGLDGYFKRLNPAFSQILGYSEAELKAVPFLDFVHPADRLATQTAMQQLSAGKPAIAFENRYRCKDGQYRWLLWNSITYPQGGLIYAAASDITERKQTEQFLSQERDFTTAILETISALVIVLDAEGCIVRFNRACEHLSGYSEKEVLGRYIWDFLLLPEEVSRFQAIFERLIQRQSQTCYEHHWVGKTGQSSLIAWSNTVLSQPSGQINYIIGTGIDITEHRQNQVRLEHQNRQSQLLSEVTQKIRQSLDLSKILQTTTCEVQHLLGCDRVFVLKVQAEGSGLPVAEAVVDPQFSLARISPGHFNADCLSYYSQHPLSVINNIAETSQALRQQIGLDKIAAQAELSVTILKQNQHWGILIAQHCHRTRDWNPLEQNLMQQLADQLGIAIDQATLFDSLEVLVEQRTHELTQINTQLQQEIAERQQITAALQESEQQLAGILNIAGEAIISIDQDQIIRLFNKEAERIFGYLALEVIGQPLDILVPKVFQKIHRQHVQDFEQSEDISRRMSERRSQVYGRRKNGSEFPAEASISRLKTKNGHLFTVMLKDVSQRYQSEQALQRSEAQLRLITNALPVLISYLDTDQRYRFNNYAYESWLGIPYTQIENVHIKDLLGEDTYQVIQPYLEKALAGTPVAFETEFPHQDGNRHWVSISYIPDIEANRVKGCFGLVSDISDRKAAEQVKDDFVSVVSHELRTPLTSVHGSLKLLATGQLGELTSQGQDLLNIALNNTERLTRLINDVLDLERIESGRVTMAKELCSAAELVQKATQAMQSMALQHQIQLQVEAAPAALWADPDHIEQTLTNLLSNAIKFSPPGEKVCLTALDQGQRVLFQVKDHGRGIPEESLETIFERFKQVDASDSRKHGGTGLGLAICREIVQRHGGRIWVTSVHGRGSTFCFTLPKTEAVTP